MNLMIIFHGFNACFVLNDENNMKNKTSEGIVLEIPKTSIGSARTRRRDGATHIQCGRFGPSRFSGVGCE